MNDAPPPFADRPNASDIEPDIEPAERAYYLTTFADHTIVLAAVDAAAADECAAVGTELVAAGARVVLVTHGARTAPVASGDIVTVWRDLEALGTARLTHADPAAAAAHLAAAGRVHKLVLVGAAYASAAPGRSFVDVAAAGLPAALASLAQPLYEGVDGVNVVAPGGVARELFTYEGAGEGVGTLLTLGAYGAIRRLGFDDYAAVAALLRRGCDDGFLRPRSDAEIADLLPRSLGFFVGGGAPAGVVALADHPGESLGELEALFTISRFHGEGIGRRLVDALDDEALRRGVAGLYAVTVSDAAAQFFAGCGYAEVAAADLPAREWAGYPPERLAKARCFLHRLAG